MCAALSCLHCLLINLPSYLILLITENMGGFVQLVILLADDMILLSSATVIGLQIQMKSLFIDGSWLQLQVNMNESNIVVFTKG